MLTLMAQIVLRLSLVMAAFSRNPELRFQRVKYMTVNQMRAQRGLPKFNVPQADYPFITTGTGPKWLDAESEWKPEADK